MTTKHSQYSCLKIIQKIIYPRLITSIDYGKIKKRSVNIEKGRCNWIGHIMRRNENDSCLTVLTRKQHGGQYKKNENNCDGLHRETH